MSIDSKIALAMSADGASFEEVHDNLVKVADEFAIGFAEFQSRFLTKPVEGRFYCYHNSQWITTKQLLEIYKQEKGL